MKYFLGLLASIGLIVLVFILILRAFSGGSTTQSQTPLSDYANTNTLIRMTVAGRIVSEQEHRAYQITVGQSEVRAETFKGYEHETIDTKMYQNNHQSFNNFLRALDLASFTKGTKDKDAEKKSDERGVCPDGRRYVFEILRGNDTIQRYWATSCGGEGTFKGKTDAVLQLFEKQIPTTDRSKTIGRLAL